MLAREYHKPPPLGSINDPVTPQDLLATVYRHLGINYRHEFLNFAGRPVPILSHGKPIAALS